MISSSCSDLISLGKAGISSSPSKGASKRSDGLILFSIIFRLSGDIAHSVIRILFRGATLCNVM